MAVKTLYYVKKQNKTKNIQQCILQSWICKLFYKFKTYEQHEVFLRDKIPPEQVIKVKFFPQEKKEIHLVKFCDLMFSVKWIAKLIIQYPQSLHCCYPCAKQICWLFSTQEREQCRLCFTHEREQCRLCSAHGAETYFQVLENSLNCNLWKISKN